MAGEKREILVIQYSRQKPCVVTVRRHWDNSMQPWLSPETDGARRASREDYDFACSRNYGQCFYHLSGGGGDLTTYNLGQLSGGTREIWADESVTLTKTVKRKGQYIEVPVRERELPKLGYKRLKRPRLLTSSVGKKTRDPFEYAEQRKTVYSLR